MEFHKFLTQTTVAYAKEQDKSPDLMHDQRIGQYFFNELAKVRPDIASHLRGSLCDPFHDDTLLSDFLIKTEQLWEAK